MLTLVTLIFADIDNCQSVDAFCGSGPVCNQTIGPNTCECPLGFADNSTTQNPLVPFCVGESSIIFHLETILHKNKLVK